MDCSNSLRELHSLLVILCELSQYILYVIFIVISQGLPFLTSFLFPSECRVWVGEVLSRNGWKDECTAL